MISKYKKRRDTFTSNQFVNLLKQIKDILLTPYTKTQDQLKDVIFMYNDEDLEGEEEEEVVSQVQESDG